MPQSETTARVETDVAMLFEPGLLRRTAIAIAFVILISGMMFWLK